MNRVAPLPEDDESVPEPSGQAGRARGKPWPERPELRVGPRAQDRVAVPGHDAIVRANGESQVRSVDLLFDGDRLRQERSTRARVEDLLRPNRRGAQPRQMLRRGDLDDDVAETLMGAGSCSATADVADRSWDRSAPLRLLARASMSAVPVNKTSCFDASSSARAQSVGRR